MKQGPQGSLVPFDFNDIYAELPHLSHLKVEIQIASFEPIDSSNVTPTLWVRLAELIRDRYAEFDGFVVLHGTDTMAYSASALSFMLENLDKPVVFTGSQLPIGILRTDGRENLVTAIEIASAYGPDGLPMVPEVSLYFQSELLRGNRTTKYSAEALDAFRSENYSALAEVGVGIHYRREFIRRPTRRTEKLEIFTDLCTDVTVVRVFPGMSEAILRAMLCVPGLRGVILETYGAGNAPTTEWLTGALREAIDKGVAILNVTQCANGSVEMGMYETSAHLARIGVVSGRDITAEAALTKMMTLLGKGEPELLGTALRGEMEE